MKILSIGTDRKLFEEDSRVLLRSKDYASETEEYHIVVFSLLKYGFLNKKIDNLYIYPTNSSSKLSYVFDGARIAREIIVKNIRDKWVITSQDPFESGLSAFLIKRKFGFPMQLQIHTDFLDRHFKTSILNRLRVIIAKFLIRKADGIRVVSENIKDSIKIKLKLTKVEPKVLPIFVDIENIINIPPNRDIKKDFSQFKFIILMASRFTKEKRIDIAIKAMKRVLNEFPNTGLVICGSGPEKKNLISLVQNLNLESNVILAGWQEDLISYYKTSDLFLLTSEYEGYGMTLVEAGASGCPIVTTKVGLAKTEIFKNGENCQICDKLDSECISKALISVISDNQKRESLGHKMQYSIRFMMSSKDEYVKKYIRLLEDLTK